MTDLLDDDEDEWSEITDARFSRCDLVAVPANGSPGFLVMKQAADAAGLLDADYVRDLVAKTEPEPQAEPDGPVTMTGSPGAMAAFIHKAAERAEVGKAEQSTSSQNDLPDSAFAFIEDGGKKDADGKTTPRSLRHFPVNDAAHTRNALARASSSPFGDKAMPKIRSAAKRFGVEVSKESGVTETVTKDIGPDLDGDADAARRDGPHHPARRTRRRRPR